jgi:hypothetical protein
MKCISKDEALRGIPVEERTSGVRKQIQALKDLYLPWIEDAASFLSLIFEQRTGTRILAPAGKPCTRQAKGFDVKLFGWLMLVLPNQSELEQTRLGTFYIHDGNHRALVLAKRICMNEMPFPGVECLLVVPRPQ